MRSMILGAIACVLTLVVVVVYWKTFFSTGDKARRPLVQLRQEALEGKTAEIRLSAALGVVEYSGDPEWNGQAILALREIAEKGKDVAAKCAAMDGLRRAKDWESLPTIFVLMNDESEELRGKAGVAAQELIGADYRFSAKDAEKIRKGKIGVMRKYFEDMNQAKAKGAGTM